MNDKQRQKRILVIRTDRIGDVVLSTPVIELLRRTHPDAYIAMMVRPYARDIVRGNPYLNEVILYDKDAKYKSFLANIPFIFFLREKRFDLALILHSTNRVNIITFLAGIRERVGYYRKCGFLLTKRLADTKHEGKKHESEYTLDVLRSILKKGEKGEPEFIPRLFMPIRAESEQWIKNLLRENNIRESDKLVVINPGASCPSRIWPAARFAAVGDKLIERWGVKVAVTSGTDELKIGEKVVSLMHYPVLSLSGKTDLSQLASLLKHCRLLISNDSGPVHIAAALGAPVISIFSRNDPGISPCRWRPLGDKSIVLHKDIGCRKCLAHNCKIGFKCLKAISVEEVFLAAEKIGTKIGTGYFFI